MVKSRKVAKTLVNFYADTEVIDMVDRICELRPIKKAEVLRLAIRLWVQTSIDNDKELCDDLVLSLVREREHADVLAQAGFKNPDYKPDPVAQV